MLIVLSKEHKINLLISENPRGCGPPPEITNGSIAAGSLQQYQHGSRTKYECDTIFKLVGSKEIECVDGQWSPPPSCIGILHNSIYKKLWCCHTKITRSKVKELMPTDC